MLTDVTRVVYYVRCQSSNLKSAMYVLKEAAVIVFCIVVGLLVSRDSDVDMDVNSMNG